MDDLWSKMDYKIFDSVTAAPESTTTKMEVDNPIIIKQEELIGDVVKNVNESEKLVSEGLPTMVVVQNLITPKAVTLINNNINRNNNNSSNSNSNKSNIVIKSEDKKPILEMMDDYEHLIDNVNSSYNNSRSNNSNNKLSSLSTFNHNNRNPLSIPTPSELIVDLLPPPPPPPPLLPLSSSSTSADPQLLQSNATTDDLAATTTADGAAGVVLYPKDEDAIYADLMKEIKSSWLHFRPKTPEPLPPSDDEMLAPDIFADPNRIELELRALGGQLPSGIFNDDLDGGKLQTEPFTMESLIDNSVMDAQALEELGIKLETNSATSENNMSSDSLNDFHLSLNESNEENEEIIENILQECQIDDIKSLNQTTNFWNGILEDTLNNLEMADDGLAVGNALAAGGGNVPPPKESPIQTKIGYLSDFVGLEAESSVERCKNKRRKILKRCNYLIGNSHFSVKNQPKEDMFNKQTLENEQLTAEAVPPNIAADVVENGSNVTTAIVGDVEIKQEPHIQNMLPSTSTMTTTTVLTEEEIKTEPPDEVATAVNTIAISNNATTTYIPTYLANQTIKLEPINNNSITTSSNSSVASTSSAANSNYIVHNTPYVITSQQLAAATGGGSIVAVGGNQGDTIVFTPATIQTSPIKKQINGPTDKNGENFFNYNILTRLIL